MVPPPPSSAGARARPTPTAAVAFAGKVVGGRRRPRAVGAAEEAKWGVTQLVLVVGRGAALEQQRRHVDERVEYVRSSHGLVAAAERRRHQVEWWVAAVVAAAGRREREGAVRQERCRRVGVTVLTRDLQRRRAVERRVVGRHALAQQPEHIDRVALLRSEVAKRPPRTRLREHFGATIDQQPAQPRADAVRHRAALAAALALALALAAVGAVDLLARGGGGAIERRATYNGGAPAAVGAFADAPRARRRAAAAKWPPAAATSGVQPPSP